MEPDWWPGEPHESFTQWAISQGIQVNGISPARFPGRGIGMVSTRKIKNGEIILKVPQNAMFKLNDIPESFRSLFPEGTPTYGIFAAFFTNGDPEHLQPYTLWQKTWPTRRDFEDSLPSLWPSQFSDDVLPPSISGSWSTLQKRKPDYSYESSHQNILPQLEGRLRNAWEKVVSVFPETNWETFSYYWHLINTRCFFYLMPGEKVPEDRCEALAMLPFADYFNHADVYDDVHFDGKEYSFRATKNYDEGEEIYMCYGPHTNDILLAEYGFFLDHNDCDSLYLDDIIFADLNAPQQAALKSHHYYGNYQLTSSGPCYRTEVAACLKYMSRPNWRAYVAGRSSRGFDGRRTANVLRDWIGRYAREAENVIPILEEKLRGIEKGHKGKGEILLKRWRQVQGLCQSALEGLSSD